jgi:pimeloyl-ACP methyl ester carboxylesterase
MPIHYTKIGKGKTILLLCHGFGESAFIWDNLAKKLAKKFTLIIPNLQGCHPTPLINKNLRIIHMVNNLHEIICKEKIKKFCFLGHSMGGYIGLAYAKKYESFLQSLCLINSTAFPDTPEKKEQRKKTNQFIAKNPIEIYLKTSIPNLYGTAFKNKGAINNHIKNAEINISKEALIAQNTAMIYRLGSIAYLKKTKLPIHFIIGQADQVIPLAKSEAQAYLPFYPKVHILPNVGHMSFIEVDISGLLDF